MKPIQNPENNNSERAGAASKNASQQKQSENKVASESANEPDNETTNAAAKAAVENCPEDASAVVKRNTNQTKEPVRRAATAFHASSRSTTLTPLEARQKVPAPAPETANTGGLRPWLELPYAHGGPLGHAVMRAQLDDFQVFERLSVQPSGEGEHLWIKIRKAGLTSGAVAEYYSRVLKIQRRDIGLAGQKDKYAVTEQWLSLWLPGKPDPSPETLQLEGCEILQMCRHNQKLRPAVGRGNRFVIRLRDVSADADKLQQRLQQIASVGVPNYFGPQRFGRNGDNVEQAAQWFAGNKAKPRSAQVRGMYLSAVRSAIFNELLANRLINLTWITVQLGDWLSFVDGNSGFVAQANDLPDLQQRVAEKLLNITGPLAGIDSAGPTGNPEKLERQIIEIHQQLLDGLTKQNVAAARRALRLIVTDLSVNHVTDKQLELHFSLPAGAFATAVIREIVSV